MTFKAIYLPASDNPPCDKNGFLTEEDAWNYVLENHLCPDCKTEYTNFLNNVKEDWENGVFASSFPACACEWLVIDEDDHDT